MTAPEWLRRDFFSCFGLLSLRWRRDIRGKNAKLDDAYWLVLEDLQSAAMGLLTSQPEPLPGQASIFEPIP